LILFLFGKESKKMPEGEFKMKKFQFTGKKHLKYNWLNQIVAIRDFGNIRNGDIGGWLSNEHNLSHEGNC